MARNNKNARESPAATGARTNQAGSLATNPVGNVYSIITRNITMPTKRNTYKYHFKKGYKTVHTDITNDLDRRETEHQSESGRSKGHIKQAGLRTTHKAAFKWKREQDK